MAKKVKVRMVRGPSGEAPRPWLIGPPFLPESYRLDEDPVDVSEEAAEILLDPERADEMRGRVFEVVGERPKPAPTPMPPAVTGDDGGDDDWQKSEADRHSTAPRPAPAPAPTPPAKPRGG